MFFFVHKMKNAKKITLENLQLEEEEKKEQQQQQQLNEIY